MHTWGDDPGARHDGRVTAGGGVEAMIDRLEAEARRRLDPPGYDYVAGGAGAETSLGEATAAWRDYRFLPRVLRDVSAVTTTVDLFGTALASPVGVAPFGYQGRQHPDAETATAVGAQRHLFVLSTRADRAVEDVAAVAGPWWFQAYVTADRAIGDDLVRRAAAAGARAVVLTGDTPFVGRKARTGPARPVDAAAEQDPSVTLADIDRLARLSGLPVLVKGVLRADDTKAVLDAGAAGVIVSNHGGRQLDRAIAPAHALADVVAAAGDAPVLVDGGIRSGHDVLTAVALGARAVLMGRPVAWALTVDGARGVADLLAALDSEFAHVLALSGHTSCADVGPDLIRRN